MAGVIEGRLSRDTVRRYAIALAAIEAAHLIACAATTDELRARAREGARRGGAAWWAFHRAIAAEHVHA